MKRLILALLILGLAACGSTGAPRTSASLTTPSTETPPTSQAPPTTVATPTESTGTPTSTSLAATTTTTEPSAETIAPSGFWDVRIGESVAENEERIGFPLHSGADPDPTMCVVFTLPEVGGIYFIATAPDSTGVSDPGDLVVGRVTSSDPRWATVEGVAVGMSVADAESIVGEAIVDRPPHAYVEGGEYLVVGPENARYLFETDGRAITAVHAGVEPVVSFVEACS